MRAGEALGPLVSQHSSGTLVLFSEDEHDASLQAHLAAGGSAVFARKGRIVHAEGDRVTDVAPLVADALRRSCWRRSQQPGF